MRSAFKATIVECHKTKTVILVTQYMYTYITFWTSASSIQLVLVEKEGGIKLGREIENEIFINFQLHILQSEYVLHGIKNLRRR